MNGVFHDEVEGGDKDPGEAGRGDRLLYQNDTSCWEICVTVIRD